MVTTSKLGPQRESVYQPFWALTLAGLRYACKRLGLTLTPDAEQQLMNQYRHLSAFPENREVLQSLKSRGIVTGVLSNGDPDMLGVAVRSAGLGDVLDHVISVDPIRKYKTHPEAYALGEQATGLACGQIAFVSSNKLYIELQRKQGAIWARLVADMLKRPARVIGRRSRPAQ